MEFIELIIPLEERMFVWKSHEGYGVKSWNPLYKEREYVQWHIKRQYKADVLSCPVRVSYDFYFIPPKSVSKKTRAAMIAGEIKHTVRPDAGNCKKFWEDCLKKIVVTDDSLCYRNEEEKHYGEKLEVVIRLYPYRRLCTS